MSAADYEVRFLNADGSVALLFVTSSESDQLAIEAALKAFATELKPFEIWRGQTFVAKGAFCITGAK